MYRYLTILAVLLNVTIASAQKNGPTSRAAAISDHDRLQQAKTDSLCELADLPTKATLNLGIETIYTLNNGFKFDIAYKPAHKRYAIELTPEVYAGPHVWGKTKDEVSGAGIGLYHVIYLLAHEDHPAYISYGATYRDIRIAYSDEGFLPYQRDGLAYYQHRAFDDVLKSTSLLVNANIGARPTNGKSPVFVDIYGGIGYKFANSEATYPGFRSYSSQMWAFGYKGPLFLLGVKFGPTFRFKE